LSGPNRAVGRSNDLENLREIDVRGRRRGPIVARGSVFDVGSGLARLGRADWRYRRNELPQSSTTPIADGAGLGALPRQMAPLGDRIGFVPPKYANATSVDGSTDC
jgi:hypothetical protein